MENKFEFIIKEMKKMYPKITEAEINELMDRALSEDNIQNEILNCMCYLKKYKSK
jgi:hypothetical protein